LCRKHINFYRAPKLDSQKSCTHGERRETIDGMNKPTNRCAGQIWTNFNYASCGKSAAYECEGKYYCKTHHPPTVFAKNKAKTEKWEQEWNQKDAARKAELAAAAEQKRRADCFPDLLEALKCCYDLGIDANLVPMVKAAIAKATGTP